MDPKVLVPAGLSWMVTVVLLLGATWYNFMTKGELGIIGIIFFISIAVYFISRLVMKRK
jgi:hypothetical protein